jgi:hypothetical protein
LLDQASLEDLTIVGGDRYARLAFPGDTSPSRRWAVSQAQEFIPIYLWGFIESRGHIPQLVEAYGDLTGEFAIMNSNERAMELGFSAKQSRDVTSVFEGTDDAGPFELRQFYLEDIEVNGTHVLFEEANDLAEAVADLLRLWGRFREVDPSAPEPQPVGRVRRRLHAYDERWEIRRG